MGFFRREWTPEAADEWTSVDFWACVFSSISYLFLTVGAATCLIIPIWGGMALVVGVAFAIWMYWIIDPKLRMISEEYESKQQRYLEDLDRLMKWEED